MQLTQVTALLIASLLMLVRSAAAAGPTVAPIHGKLGQKFIVQLKAGEKQQYDLDLPAGRFLVVCDSRALGDIRRLAASLALLNKSGAPLLSRTGQLAAWNKLERLWRDGKSFTLAKPTSLRLQLANTDASVAAKYWLTVIPDEPTFVRFGFGNEVLDRPFVDGNIGVAVGNTIQYDVLNFQRATLPAGKWTISLNAASKTSQVYASLLVLDARGFYDGTNPNTFHLIVAADVFGGEKTVSKTLNLNAPQTLIFRIWNEGAGYQNLMTYDVNIEKAAN